MFHSLTFPLSGSYLVSRIVVKILNPPCRSLFRKTKRIQRVGWNVWVKVTRFSFTRAWNDVFPDPFICTDYARMRTECQMQVCAKQNIVSKPPMIISSPSLSLDFILPYSMPWGLKIIIWYFNLILVLYFYNIISLLKNVILNM